LAVITMIGSALTFGLTQWYLAFVHSEDWKRLLTEHYQAIVGSQAPSRSRSQS